MEECSHDNAWEASLKEKLQNLSPLPSKCCIYRVPERIRHENAKAYTPKVVSIGPIHHGDKALQAMEEHKLLYLKSFLEERAKISLEVYIEFIKKKEQEVRNHYSETFERIGHGQFVKMILVDAAFVIELLWRNALKEEKEKKKVNEKGKEKVEENKNDRILYRPWKVLDITNDLILLENQLPFFVFEDIVSEFKLNVPLDSIYGIVSLSYEKLSLIKAIYEFFRNKAYLGEIGTILTSMESSTSKIRHFVDFFRKCHLPRKQPPKNKIKTLTIPSVTDLYHAGVEFKVRRTESLFDVHFCRGTLEIPQLQIRKSTESFFLNLLAFEQCHFLDGYISDYFFIIDRLVDTTSAVQLLVRSGVIEHKLPDNQEVVTFINNLARAGILRSKRFYFNDLCDSLNAHHSNRCNKWVAAVKHGYFSSPLTIFAVVVATLAFILTVLQTVCSCGGPFKK